MIKKFASRFVLYIVIIMMTCIGCASIQPPKDYEPPIIDIISFNLLPSKGVAPDFELTLSVTNPNKFNLPLKGLVYKIIVEDYRIFTGVSNKLPVVPSYDKKQIKLEGSWNLLNSIGAIANLIGNKSSLKDFKNLYYTMDIKLDMGPMHPPLRIHKKMKVSQGMEISS